MSRAPGDRITAEAWNGLQIGLRGQIARHGHHGGPDASPLPGSALAPDATVRAAEARAGRLILGGRDPLPARDAFVARLPGATAGPLAVRGEVEVAGGLTTRGPLPPVDRLPSVTVSGTQPLVDPRDARWQPVATLALSLDAPTVALLVSRWAAGGLAPARHTLSAEGIDRLPVAALAAAPELSTRDELTRWCALPAAVEARATWGGGQPPLTDASASWLMEAAVLPAGAWTLTLELWPAGGAVTTASLTAILS